MVVAMKKRAAKSLFAVVILMVFSAAANAYQDEHIKVSLISEQTSLQPGKTSWLGVLFEPADHWHVYWQNPGDSGFAPRIHLELPPGVSAGDIHWPAPEYLPTQGLMNYGYQRVLLMLPIAVNKSIATGKPLTISADIDWLVCEEACVPGTAKLHLTLPVNGLNESSADAVEFAKVRQLLPVAMADKNARYRVDGDRVILEALLDTPVGGGKLAIYPITADLVNYAQKPTVQRQGNRLIASFPLSDYFIGAPQQFDFVLVDGSGLVLQGSARP